MLILKYLIVFTVIGYVYSGGTSVCSCLRGVFVELMSVSQSLLERVASQTVANSLAYPAVKNSLISELKCNFDVVIDILSEELNLESEVDKIIIAGILNGNKSSEFPFPLSCIKKEMLTFVSITDYILENTYGTLESVSSTPPDFGDSCEDVVQYVSDYYLVVNQFVHIRTSNNFADAIDFKNIRQFDLYLRFHDSINKCTLTTLTKSVAELLNSDANLTLQFTTNSEIELPKPLSCITGLFSSGIAQVRLGYVEFNKHVFNLNHQNACLPLADEYGKFVDIWTGYVDELQNYAIENTLKYPTLASTFISDLECEAHRMLIFAVNATSQLAGITFDDAFNVLNNPLTPPFGLPLDCISDDLIYIRNYIWTIIKSIAPGLNVFQVASTDEFGTCAEVLTQLSEYVSPLMQLTSAKEVISECSSKQFKSINMYELFEASLLSNGECMPSFLSSFTSKVLNSDNNVLNSYLNDTTSSLSFPFSCIEPMIDSLKDMSNYTITDYRANIIDSLIPEIIDIFG